MEDTIFLNPVEIICSFLTSRIITQPWEYYRGESATLGHFSVSIFFGQVDNEESKNKYRSIAV